MSSETLDALELAAQTMDVQFNDNPGIFIGDSFFPMRSLKEDSPHELYLRVPSATKQMAPLRLYANVTGKFTLERELDDRMKDRIREVTIDAAKQRERKVKLIDNPPDLPSRANVKKRKDAPTMFRNVVRPSDQAKLISSSSSPAPTSSKSSNKDDSLRKRLVHCIAVSDRTRDTIVKMVGGPDCDASLRHELLDLLEKIAEPIPSTRKDGDHGLRSWRLKTVSWLEVRPFEWPKLTEPERVAMARTARQKLDSLHIPESDPAWKHVAYRSTTNNLPGAPSASSSSTAKYPVSSTDGAKSGTAKVDAPKRGVSSKEMKEKKVKPKFDSKAEIQMKDESARAAPRTSNVNEQTSPSKPVVSQRKTPGSGFRMGKSTSQEIRSNTTPDSSTQVVPSRTKLADGRVGRDNEPAASHAKPPHRIPQPVSPERKVVSVMQPQHIRKMKEDAGGGTDSEREKHVERARVLRREKTRTKEHGAVEISQPVEEDPSTLKRKKVTRDDDDYEATSSRSALQKKRKLEHGSVSTSSTGEGSRVKDLPLPKKPELAPASRPKVKMEPSPIPQQTPLPKIKKDVPRTSLSTQEGKASIHESTTSSPHNQPRKRDDSRVAHKPRRRSPIYTSSEDEALGRSPRRAVSVGPLPTPPMTTHHAVPPGAHSHSRSHAHVRETRPLPADHANLRVRYSTSYLEYLSKFHKLVAQKGKIDSMLKSSDVVSAGSITDSDGDVELMDPEELARLSSEYRVLEEELETIRNIFSSH